MPEDARFLIKLVVASATIAALIKYVGPQLPLPATGLATGPVTGAIALILVMTPVAGVALWMVWQAQR